MKHLGITLIINLIAQISLAQNQTDTLSARALAPVLVTTTRFEHAAVDAPYAISQIGVERLQRGALQLALTETLTQVPGVFALNPDNFAQDLRVSIRGFGARSAFGIRGIRVLVDGLPESTPDGQADVDNLDLSVLQNLEVLRGAASGLHGNAAGGILSFQTAEPTEKPTFGVQSTIGSFGFQKYAAKMGCTLGLLGVHLSATHNRSTGFREHSAMQQTIANGKFRYQISDKAKISFLINIGVSPEAEDAGGLTVAQVSENRRQARPQNLQFDAGESVNQQKYGALYEKKWSKKHQLKVHSFAAFRKFSSRLAFKSGGWVEFDRHYKGFGATYQYAGKKWRSQFGLEAALQRDDRRRFNNLDGSKGDQTLDQREQCRSLAAFWLHEIRVLKFLKLTLGGRADQIQLSAADRFLVDGDQSGSQKVNRLNPSAGLTLHFSPAIAVYANLNSSYETPTLNELSANPGGNGGFNTALHPQSALSVEGGTKGQLAPWLQYELALFKINLRDELVPYQLLQQPGRTFYRNAGRSERKGLEFGLSGAIMSGLRYTANYTYSDFSYCEYEVNEQRFDGKRQPGVPQHMGFAELRLGRKSGAFVVAQMQYASAFFVDDGNTTQEAERWLAHLRLGFSGRVRQVHIEPFLGANNLLSTVYNGNILLNAAGGRYFEPSAGLYFFGGLKLGFTGG